MKYLIFIGALIALMILNSCRTTKQYNNSDSYKSDSLIYIEKIRIDTLRIKGDTIVTRILCNEIKRQTIQSGRAKVDIEPSLDGKGYLLTATCDSLEKLIISYEKQIEKYKKDSNSVEKGKVETLSYWQIFWIKTGQILTTILIAFVSWKLWRLKDKVF